VGRPVITPHRYMVIDGHSFLFNVPELSKKHGALPRKARGILIHFLQQVQDYSGSKVSLVFDGKRQKHDVVQEKGAVEVWYAEEHQTADALIERAVGSYKRPAEITVVTADQQERLTVEALGACWMSPECFMSWVESVCPPRTTNLLNRC